MRRVMIPLIVICTVLFSGATLLFPVADSRAQSTQGAASEAPAYVMPKTGPFSPEQVAIPQSAYISAWSRSGHSDASSEPFAHWNGEGAIPPVCAVCHSGIGFRSFHGLDGSAPGLPEAPVAVGGVVDCETCHNPGLARVNRITMPSGLSHPVDGGEASCMTCHQGRAAGVTVSRAVGDKPDDTPDPELSFINPHYATATATLLGGYGGMGYQYEGKDYSGRFLHAKPVATCASCHDPHSLNVAEATCLTCHASGKATDIRIARVSFDGSGDLGKGIKADISANAARLKAMIEDYAARVAGVPLHYDGARHPYFFADANGDGLADRVDGKPVAYNAWTPRMLKAAYNWKFVGSDAGIHVHNPHYALELLYDSMEDLAGPTGVDFDAMRLIR